MMDKKLVKKLKISILLNNTKNVNNKNKSVIEKDDIER